MSCKTVLQIFCMHVYGKHSVCTIYYIYDIFFYKIICNNKIKHNKKLQLFPWYIYFVKI